MLNDWESDYSFLIHSVERRIANEIPGSADTRDANIRDILESESDRVAGVKRISAASISFNTSSFEEDTSETTAKRLRLTVEVDELKLANEKLTDDLKRLTAEREREKSKFGGQIVFLEEENSELRRVANSLNDKYYDEKKKWQDRVRALETELANQMNAKVLSDGAVKSQSSSNSDYIISATSRDIEKLTGKISDLEDSVTAKSNEVRHLGIVNAELAEKVSRLEQNALLSKHTSAQQNLTADNSDEKFITKKKISDLEEALVVKTRELSKLTMRLKNQSMLEEEVASLEGKNALLRNKCSELETIRERFEGLQKEKEEWSILFSKISDSISDTTKTEGITASPPSVTPAAVLRAFSDSQKRALTLSESLGESDIRISGLKRALLRAEAREQESQSLCIDAETRLTHAENKLSLAQQRCRLFEGEIKSLRQLVKSFDAEFTMGSKSRAKGDGSASVALTDLAEMKDRIIDSVREELEACRQNAVLMCDRAERAEQALREALTQHACVLDEMRATLTEKQREVAALQEQVRAVATHSSSGISTLDFDPSVVKVVHFALNPHALAVAAKVVVSTKRSQDSAKPTPAVSTDALQPTVTATQSVMDSDKLNQRLKEMFKERIQSFREAVYLLLGYKVDLLSSESSFAATAEQQQPQHTRLRLRSMYAENPDDALIFQWRGDKLELLDTPFANRLDPKVFAYLTTCNSVPAFLSNVTIDLFDNQTFLG